MWIGSGWNTHPSTMQVGKAIPSAARFLRGKQLSRREFARGFGRIYVNFANGCTVDWRKNHHECEKLRRIGATASRSLPLPNETHKLMTWLEGRPEPRRTATDISAEKRIMPDLIAPHGGRKEPVNRIVADAQSAEFRKSAAALKKVPVSDADLSSLYRFGDGGLSP